MTTERTIEILNPEHREHYESMEPVNEACRMAISALEKQIPIKPIKLKAEQDIKIGAGTWKAGTIVYKCRCCNSFINRPSVYCYQCGQALDWRDGK